MSNRWCSLIKDLLNKKRTWNTWNEGVKLAIITLQYLVTDILLEQQVGEIYIRLKALRYIFCDSSVFIASREKRIVKSLCYSRRNVQCVRCWISLHHEISIRSVNNTQDWRKFWKRFRVCFVFKVAYPVNENSGNSIAGISIQATLTVYLDVDVNDREDTINNYKARKKTKPPHNCGRTVRIETFLNEVLENVKAGN